MRHLATQLQKNGVFTYLDQWDVHPGMDLTQYMETCVRDSDFVLLVCTSSFARKADSGRGGAGYEKGIVTGEIFQGVASRKFVPLLREGSPVESLPSYLKSRAYVDFRDDKSLDHNLESLLRHLHQSPRYVRPPLGTKPPLKPLGSERPRRQAPRRFDPSRIETTLSKEAVRRYPASKTKAIDYGKLTKALHLLPFLRRHPNVRQIGSEHIEDFEYHASTGVLAWRALYEQLDVRLDGGYMMGYVVVFFRYSFASKRASVVGVSIDEIRPREKLVIGASGSKELNALARKLEQAIQRLFENIIENMAAPD